MAMDRLDLEMAGSLRATRCELALALLFLFGTSTLGWLIVAKLLF